MEALTIHIPHGSEGKKIKAVLKALGVSFEKKKKPASGKKEEGYNPEFVAKIKKGDEDFAAGRYTVIKLDDLWK